MKNPVEDIHQFWFGPLDEAGLAAARQHALWFSASEETDAAIATRFGAVVQQALDGDLGDWADSDSGLIALVVVLDQFTRNMYRGTPGAFAGDAAALQLARQAIRSNRHRSLPVIHRVFLYMPLEHSENLATQQECVRLFSALAEETGAASVTDFTRYAAAHRDVIARFGRFPHRNTILGRTSSAEEMAYMDTHGGF
jgi:uncharacterized protein (DUF924 family)